MVKKKIGLAGKSGSGKNVIADLMCSKFGYQQIAVADGIRHECSDFLWKALQEEIRWHCSKAKQEEFQVVIDALRQMIWEKPTPSGFRIFLQWWGTNLRRDQDPDYWIKQLCERLDNDASIVVSDVRLPDEMAIIRAAGGEVWLVERDGIPNVGIVGHITEHGLDGMEFDRVVSNNGTLYQLHQKIDELFA